MTFEEFEKLVNVSVFEHYENFELRVSISFSTMRCVTKEQLNDISQLDYIERALKLQLWEYMQKQVGHTDSELMQAYRDGIRDTYEMRRGDFEPERYRERIGATDVGVRLTSR